MGSRRWVAGTHYLQSLIYGNSMLPSDARSTLRLYVDANGASASDYSEVEAFTAGFYTTDFRWTPRPGIYPRLRKTARRLLRPNPKPAPALRRLLRKHRTKVLFAGNGIERNIEIPQVSWIPDFQHVHRPDFFSPEERENRDRHFSRVVKEAKRVIVSNQYSYCRAKQLFPGAMQKLAILPFTMYLGEDWRAADPRQVVRKCELPRKFLLFPSQFWKHKNHLTLFRAIGRLHARGLHDVVLVCTGFQEDYRFPNYGQELRDFLTANDLTASIRVLGLLPRHDQVQLMRASAAILQPSLFEGWSALVEESRSLGKVIFASDIPMHREQLTDRMHLFEATSVDMLSELLGRFWKELTPGPDAMEADAEAQYQIRIMDFARQFYRDLSVSGVTKAGDRIARARHCLLPHPASNHPGSWLAVP